ncbi:ABC transporter ATP-binding protein [Micrococcus sp.]|uniref:ABC transporter ATP-binding protein n=1 Tax=Micrococcus sp. TaxID=1271 RepID=UPI002A915178|nr:ABC transporter ATP-binding protein [Micrococcus sp.]MDY6055331.1 ABC transporter ATP-binding protein [Micrococcus sp.]
MLTRFLSSRLPEGTQYLIDRGMRIRLALVVVGSVLVALLEMVALASIVPLVNILTTGSAGVPFLEDLLTSWGAGSTEGQAVAFSVVIVVAFLLKAVLVLAFRWWTLGFTNRNLIRTSTRLLRYYLRADYGVHLTRTVGTLVNNVTGTSAMAYTGVVNGSVTLLTEAVTLVAVAIVLGVSMPLTALGMAAYFAVIALVLRHFIRRPASRLGWALVTTGERSNTAALQGLENYKDVRIRGNDSAFTGEYRAARTEAAAATRLKMLLTMMPRYVLEVAFVLAIALLVAVAFLSGRGAEAFGSLALLAMAGFRVLPSMAAIMATSNEIKTSWPAFERTVAELRDAQPVLARADTPYETLPFTESVRVDHASFSYPGAEAPVLHDITLEIPFGATIAFVGGSGAGKTTLVDLIIGFHQAETGAVLVDGTALGDDPRGWWDNVAFVPQSVTVVNGTVLENVLLDVAAARDADRAHVEQALRDAQLGEWLDSLEDGLDTVIGEGAVGVSGGQRQRLGIARALHRNPRLLVMDEATSALDNATERRVTDVIESLKGRITVIIVAHRLSTVKHADRIVLMDQGRIVGEGTFQGLQQTSPEFRELVRLGDLSS